MTPFSRRIRSTDEDEQSEDNCLPGAYEPKLSLERATPDGSTIIKRTRDEYVADFNAKLVKTARSVLEMCRVVYEAKESLDSWDFKDFCAQIGHGPNSSSIRKFVVIGKLYPRLIRCAEQLPASWTSIYLITQIPADEFEALVSGGHSLAGLPGSDLQELISQTRSISCRAASDQ